MIGALDLLAAQSRRSLIPALILFHPSKAIVLRAFELLSHADRVDVAFQFEPALAPPLARGERVRLSYTPLPGRGQHVVLRRGTGAAARTVEFARVRAATPASRMLADGEVQLQQVGQPHPAKEGSGTTQHGLDVQIVHGAERSIASWRSWLGGPNALKTTPA